MNHAGKKKEIKPCATLYIANIPSNSCAIPEIFKHFKNYGHIQSIYAYGTNASITFSSKEEAITAFKSPEAFVNNRFVRYHYHLHPDKAEDRLSLIVDKDHVQSVVKEVNEQIAQEQRRTIELQSQLKSSSQHGEDANTSSHDTADNKNVQELIALRPHIQQQLNDLKVELQTATPEKKIQIQRNIEESQKTLDEIDSLQKTLQKT